MQHRVQHIGVTSGTIHRIQHRVQHIGVTSGTIHRCNIGYNTSDATHRAQYTYIYTYCFTNAYQPPIYARVLSRGVAPISTFCPYRARYFLNPVHGGGNPGCRSPSACFTLGWDTIALTGHRESKTIETKHIICDPIGRRGSKTIETKHIICDSIGRRESKTIETLHKIGG